MFRHAGRRTGFQPVPGSLDARGDGCDALAGYNPGAFGVSSGDEFLTRHRINWSVVPAACLLGPLVASAQITVQQPVQHVFSVGTTVLVPDRGSVSLGGVGRAATGWSRYGPFVFGSSIGQERGHVGGSAHVWIHDFDEADRRLLGTSEPRRRVTSQRLDPLAAHALATLRTRARRRPPSARLPVARASSSARPGYRSPRFVLRRPRPADRRITANQAASIFSGGNNR